MTYSNKCPSRERNRKSGKNDAVNLSNSIPGFWWLGFLSLFFLSALALDRYRFWWWNGNFIDSSRRQLERVSMQEEKRLYLYYSNSSSQKAYPRMSVDIIESRSKERERKKNSHIQRLSFSSLIQRRHTREREREARKLQAGKDAEDTPPLNRTLDIHFP